jgi:hypothetical protein
MFRIRLMSCAVLACLMLELSAGVCVADDDGFVPLFDGETLDGWQGNTEFWSVADGAIVGKCDGNIPDNTFLISDGEYDNFVLKVKFRLVNHSGNSGIQFRSERAPDAPEENFVIKGYQADIASERYMGILYEEKGRGILVDVTGDLQTQVDEATHRNEWNEYVITADGDHITQVLNGVTTVDFVDPEGADRGVIALQLHAGHDMEIQFKDIEIQELD